MPIIWNGKEIEVEEIVIEPLTEEELKQPRVKFVTLNLPVRKWNWRTGQFDLTKKYKPAPSIWKKILPQYFEKPAKPKKYIKL